MKKYKFSTNIKCGNCEAKVAKVFSLESGILSFEVDLKSNDRILKVETTDEIGEQDVIKLVKTAGYEANPVKGLFKLFK